MTLVSVIIPARERPESVGGAIETVLEQTYGEVEAIVVSDGSTGDMWRELDVYRARDERVRVFGCSTGRGIADVRNRAFERARGEYVCLLDPGDRWHPRKIERQIALMESLDEAYGVVYTGGVSTRNGRIVETHRPRDDRRDDVYPAILLAFGLRPYSGHMIRAECFETVGKYDPDLERGVNWDHSIRLAHEYRFATVSDPLVERRLDGREAARRRRWTSGSRTAIRWLEDGPDSYGAIWRKYGAEIRRHPDLERRYRARWDLTRARAELEGGSRRRALGHARAAIAREPSADAFSTALFACLGRHALDLARRRWGSRPDRRPWTEPNDPLTSSRELTATIPASD